jgi:hypothetical protein
MLQRQIGRIDFVDFIDICHREGFNRATSRKDVLFDPPPGP